MRHRAQDPILLTNCYQCHSALLRATPARSLHIASSCVGQAGFMINRCPNSVCNTLTCKRNRYTTGDILVPFALPTHNNEEEAIADRNNRRFRLRTPRRKLRGRTRTWICSFYSFINRSRPHLSGDKHVQLPFMVIVIIPASTNWQDWSERSPVARCYTLCANNSYDLFLFWKMERFLLIIIACHLIAKNISQITQCCNLFSSDYIAL